MVHQTWLGGVLSSVSSIIDLWSCSWSSACTLAPWGLGRDSRPCEPTRRSVRGAALSCSRRKPLRCGCRRQLGVHAEEGGDGDACHVLSEEDLRMSLRIE